MAATIKSKILSTGMFIPKKIVTNDDLAKTLDTSNEWIVERTGISERHISSPDGGEFPSDMAKFAAEMAFSDIGFDRNQIDMIIFATVTPDMPLPCTASLLQTKLEITSQCACVDVSAACSGFIYAMDMADSLIRTGKKKNILVVGSEMLSTIVNWEDRAVCILLGDGCGAAILTASTDENGPEILSSHLAADGTGKEYMDNPVGGSATPITIEHIQNKSHFLNMKGRDMFKVATRTLARNSQIVLEKANLSIDEIDWLIPHQANLRIIQKTADILNLPMEKVIVNIEKYGNTSSATIPIAFHESVKNGKIKRGDICVFSAFGAGLTSGSIVLRY